MSRFYLAEIIDSNDTLVLETKFGKLVCWKVRDDEEYKEFAIDLMANDGREYQVATIGTIEWSNDPHYNDDMMHAYIWNGQHPEDPASFFMDPHGDGWYYDPKEEA